MAGAQRQPDDSLIERLVQEAPGFSFFQAVQLLHRVSPNLKAVGDVGPTEKEVLRLRVNPELKFAAGDIEDITAPKEGVQHRQFELTANFMGLVGVETTVAPLALTASSSSMPSQARPRQIRARTA